ncbi:MAG: hypothetical protein ACTHLW_15385 [Verrucomicrobiota bacterium]
MFLLVALTSAIVAAPDPVRTVEAAVKPGQPWKAQPTRLLEDLPEAVTRRIDSQLTAAGGQAARTVKAKGFFYTIKLADRWWLVDPDGGLFLHKGVTSVAPPRSSQAKVLFAEKFGSQSNWAAQTTALLRDHGFNGLGGFSDWPSLALAPQPLAGTRIWNFMSSYGRKRGGTFSQPGHTGYPNDCIFVFDPGFETFCDEHAKQLAADRENRNLLGHFSDNELPFKIEALDNYLKLPDSDPGHQAARNWLTGRHGANATAKDITDADRSAFLGVVVERYFRVVSSAIKKYDPNHLFLGSRFYGSDLRRPEIFRAAGPYLDVVSVNYYNAWSPDPARLAMWEREARKPVLVTEWYVKAEDSGMPNQGGAGWLVKTQGDRGRFYENFTLGLLESKLCVGWHWFKYIDNDPNDTKSDPSNRDSNKGILDNHYEPYEALLASMKRINERVYSLVDYFDRRSVTSAELRKSGEKLGEQ